VAIDASGDKLSKQTHAPPLPDDPLPALRSAWRFLDQPDIDAGSLAEFWAKAPRAWDAARLPPVRMLPAPRSSYVA
jgi:glutamyl-Q tRNA(Asp) synthetase